MLDSQWSQSVTSGLTNTYQCEALKRPLKKKKSHPSLILKLKCHLCFCIIRSNTPGAITHCIMADLVYHLTAVPVLGSSPQIASPILFNWGFVRSPILSTHAAAVVRHSFQVYQPNVSRVSGEILLTHLFCYWQIGKESNSCLEWVMCVDNPHWL